MRYQLSLDSCTKACSVALTPLDGGEAYQWFEILQRGHAEIIADKVQKLMQDAQIKASDISQIAVTIGPGTFTGARIALSFARMFAAARGIPIIAVNSLEAIAFNAVKSLSTADKNSSLNRNELIHTAIDARRGQVYWASFNLHGEPCFAPEAIEIAEAVKLIGTGSIILGTGRDLIVDLLDEAQHIQHFSDELHFPQAGIFGTYVQNRTAETTAISPLYLRAADAKLPASHPITFTQ